MTNDNTFIGQLDELIGLFKQLKNKAVADGAYIKDEQLFDNFEQLANQYESMKKVVPENFIEEVGGPLKTLLTGMVEQLKAELYYYTPDNNKLDAIDTLLKNESLTEAEINKLLDQRSNLK